MKRIFLTLPVLIYLSGCATIIEPPQSTFTGLSRETGIYHAVQRGQTLWNIAKLYDVGLRKIVKANYLPDASKIEVGQLIFVPGVSEAIEEKYGRRKIKSLENFVWPVKGVVVSYFGSTRDMVKNKGIAIEAQYGENVVASRGGKVTFCSEHMKGYGKTIIIDHLDGFQTVYAHNAQNLTTINQVVKQGEVIAKVGTTGRAVRPTVHFEIRKEHKPQNPFYYLP